MPIRKPSGSRRLATLALTSLGLAAGCLNPRPEEDPSFVGDSAAEDEDRPGALPNAPEQAHALRLPGPAPSRHSPSSH